MVTLEWDLERTDGVTLVRLFATADRECRVRIENRLDGPVWPPRTQGRPAAGWDDDEYTGVVPADGRLSVGYATPAEPSEPPAAVVETAAPDDSTAPDDSAAGADASPDTGTTDQSGGTAGSAEGDGDPDAGVADVPVVEQTPDGVIRSLGDPVVPRDCVPVPDVRHNGHNNDAGADQEPTNRDVEGPSEHVEPASATAPDADAPAVESPLLVPGAVRAWLGDVERRLDAVEDGAIGDRSVGGEEHAAVVAAERRALSWVGRRAEALAARAADGDPP